MTVQPRYRIVNSHTGFQPLKEVWLGDTYPDHFFEHLDSKLRDIILQISDMTRTDLNIIQKLMETFDVKVCRPEFDSVDNYLDEYENLIKPPITPRDWAMTLGNKLYILPQYQKTEPFQKHIDLYGDQVKILNRFTENPEDWCYVTFPAVVRAGKDIFIDYSDKDPVHRISHELVKQGYRIHLSNTGDHSDGVFALLKPKQILSTHYRSHFDQGFPGWNVIHLPDSSKKFNGFNGKWWVPGINSSHFNNSMIDKFETWLGNPTETIFEVNCLVIDEKNVLILSNDEIICKQLEEVGITPHVVNFRTREFWDGGLHCLTVDIHREGGCVDYWPERGSPGIDYNTEYV